MGVLAIREPGGPDAASRGLKPKEGFPRIVTAGRFLATPGGYFPGLAREIAEDDLPTAALEEFQVSGGWVRVIGDHPGSDGRFRLHWTLATLHATVEVVHQAGGKLAIHAVATPAIEAAVVTWLYRWTDANGQAGHVRGVDVMRVQDGKVAECLGYVKG